VENAKACQDHERYFPGRCGELKQDVRVKRAIALGRVWRRRLKRGDASTTLWLIVKGKYWKAPPIKIKNKWRVFN
jgi:hypothetical protein